ncbi:MAG TPA: phosphoribosyltransferase family protein [Polyangiaceae bacterium]|nr:phosphoribosyltransferase family protein [Polyangiaceae bacterium]
MAPFTDRRDAGRKLGRELQRRGETAEAVVLGLPRGGVPVAAEVAAVLGAGLDVFLVRKLGVPGQEELAFGAIASGGLRTLNHDVVQALGIPERVIDAVAAREQRELERRESAYRDGRPPAAVDGETVIVVDDGLATGASMRVALAALRRLGPKRLIAAVPIAPADTCSALLEIADEVVCAETPQPFYGVGQWYADFSQVSDDEVRAALERSGQRARAPRRDEHAHR